MKHFDATLRNQLMNRCICWWIFFYDTNRENPAKRLNRFQFIHLFSFSEKILEIKIDIYQKEYNKYKPQP